MDDRELHARLDDLAARLSRVEEVVGLASPQVRAPAASPTEPATPVETIAPSATPPLPLTPPTEPMVTKPPLLPPTELPSVASPAEEAAKDEESLKTFVTPGVDEADLAVMGRPPRPTADLRRLLHAASAPVTTPRGGATASGPERSKPARPALEMIIGERWMAWVGAIVVVVGVGFFVKLAYDMGWWGALPPIVKCLVAAAFGAGLVAAGEVALRRVGRMAAVSLYGAGLGTLYLTAYATFRWFDLVPQAGAFGLMFCVALLGIGLTIRGRMLAIGVLSLLGGYGTPILLHEQTTFAAALPLYVSALLVIALVLSARIAAPFRVLRYVALGLHIAVSTAWLVQEGEAHWLIAMVFLTLWWVLLTAEALYAAKREQSARGNPIATLLTTFWYVTAGCGVLAAAEPGARNWLGIFTGGVAAACAWAALTLTGIGVLRAVPRRAMDLMTTALWAQVGVLLAAAIGLHFHGESDSFGESLGWIVMGVGCVELGRRLPSRGVDVFGLLVGTLGVWWVWAVNAHMTALRAVVWGYGDLTVTRWALLAFAAVLATYVVGRRLRAERGTLWGRSCAALALAATVQWLVAWPSAAAALVQTAGWLVVAGVLLGTARLARSHGYRFCGLLLLVAGIGRWLVFDALWTRWSPGWAADLTVPVLNWQMAVAVLAVVVMAVGYRDRAVRERQRSIGADGTVLEETWPAQVPGQWLLACASVFLLIALSFELEHVIARLELTRAAQQPWAWPAQQVRILWCALLWACGGLMTALVGFRWRLLHWAHAGVVLVVGSALAWLVPGALWWRLEQGVVLVPVGANLVCGMGLVLAVLLGVVYRSMRRQEVAAGGAGQRGDAATVLVSAWLVVLLALACEVDRLVGFREAAAKAHPLVWPGLQLRLVGWTLLTATGGLAAVLWGGWRRERGMFLAGYVTICAASVAWLTVDTVYWRCTQGVLPCPPVVNLQLAAGLLTAAGVALAARRAWRLQRAVSEWRLEQWAAVPYGIALVVLTGLWLGSLELDRYFAPEAQRVDHAAMARQAALSVYWGVYAIGLVALGFWRRWALARYAGLGLLAVTLGKVLLVDLKHLDYAYRVLSFMAVGLLFIVTSVAYARLAKVIEGARTATGAGGTEDRG